MGFFGTDIVQSIRESGKNSCLYCGRFNDAPVPRLGGFGGFQKQILILVPQPGGKDTDGVHVVGKITKVLSGLNCDVSSAALTIAVNRCHGDDPSIKQVECCRKNVMAVIKEKSPAAIIAFGKNALFSLIGDRYPEALGAFDVWRGQIIPDQELGCWIHPVWAPDDVYMDRPEMVKTWQDDLAWALTYYRMPFRKYTEPEIVYLDNDLSELNNIQSGVISFDYETTGIKPHAPGHRIVCASVAVSADKVYAFMLPETRSAREPFLQLLRNPEVGKMAHNMKFEDTWSRVRLRTEVQGWQWDSMLAAHILDNRTSTNSLKFQTYVHFGVIDYASEVSPYLRGKEDGANSLNRIMELIKTASGRQQLLKYCAMDSIFQYRLSILQKNKIPGCGWK